MPRVLVIEAVRAQILEFAGAARPDETGGILLGYLGDGDPWITHAVEIATQRGRRTSYRIPAGITRGIVAALVERDPDLGYLGDWHSHPVDQTASCTDRLTLASLTLGGLLERRRVMIIARLTPDGWVIDAWRRPRFREVTCTVELTGPALRPKGVPDD